MKLFFYIVLKLGDYNFFLFEVELNFLIKTYLFLLCKNAFKNFDFFYFKEIFFEVFSIILM